MKIGEMRTSVRLAVRTDDYDDQDIDRAFRDAVQHMENRRVDVLRAVGTKALTPNSNEIDLSAIAGFRSNRLIIAEIGYNNRGTWSTSLGSVAKNDLVQGDGDPDSYLYVCTNAHTAAADKEPPNSAFWTRVENKLGTPLKKRDYMDVVHGRTGGRPQFFRQRRLDWRRVGGLPGAFLQPDRPQWIGFRTHTLAYVWPTPQLAYPLNLVFRRPMSDWAWEWGSSGAVNTEIPIPDEYMYLLVNFGVPAYLERPDPTEVAVSLNWQLFEQEIQRIRSNDSLARPILYRQPNWNGA